MARTGLTPISQPTQVVCATSRADEATLHNQYRNNFQGLAHHGQIVSSEHARFVGGVYNPVCGSADRLYQPSPSTAGEMLINIPVEIPTLRPSGALSGTVLDSLLFHVNFSINNIPVATGGSGQIRGRIHCYLTVNAQTIDLYRAREVNDSSNHADEVAWDATTAIATASERIRYEAVTITKEIPDAAIPPSGSTYDGILTLRYYDFLPGTLTPTDSRGPYCDVFDQSSYAEYFGIDSYYLKIFNDWI